jgi:hypothetical protein
VSGGGADLDVSKAALGQIAQGITQTLAGEKCNGQNSVPLDKREDLEGEW